MANRRTISRHGSASIVGASTARRGVLAPCRRRLAFALGLLASFLPLSGSPAIASEIPLTEHTVAGAFDGARSVASADVDGDGDLDILGAAYDADDIAWWKNTAGDGTAWREQTVDGNFDGATSVASADVDGDGDLDVLGAAYDADDIAWWENTGGDGSSWTKHTVDGDFDGASSVVAADVDGDGDLDVLGAAVVADDITWWENDGTPQDDTGGDGNSWTKHTVAPAFNGARSVASADVDGDGDLDILAAATYADDIAWWENTAGDGSTWTKHTVAATFDGAFSVASGDVDGDGDLDVLGAAYQVDAITWWENDGTPQDDTGGDGNSWTEHTVDGAFNGARAVASADMDGDGDLDVLGAATYADDIAWWENDGTPQDDTGGDGNSWTEHTVVGAFDGARAVASADVDGDGDLDVLGAATSADDITWWENTTLHSSAVFPTEHTVGGAFDDAYAVASGDVDGDGDLDVVGIAYDAGGALTWWENDGTPQDDAGGDGNSWIEHAILGQYRKYSVAFADVDGDGDLDVLFGASGAIYWWENTAGDGSTWSGHVVGGLSGGEWMSATSADVDGDGDLDVLGAAWQPGGGAVAWWENTAGDASAWTDHLVDGDFAYASSVASGDVDGDGDLDVLGASYTADTVAWWENDGTPQDDLGGDGNSWTEHLVDATFEGVWSVASADVDGDGDLDVLGAAYDANDIAWWENTGSDGSAWTKHTVDGTFYGAHAVASADMDGDGDLDVLGAAHDADDITWWENDGTPRDDTGGAGNSWTKQTVDGAFDGASSVASGDVDGDGDLDILGAAQFAADIAWWENRGGQFALSTVDTAPAKLAEDTLDDLLEVAAIHRGRSGDRALELATLELLFEETPGDPLTTAEAKALVQDLRVYLDDGSGVFDIADSMVVSVSGGALSLDAGVQTVPFTDGASDVRVEQATPRTYFVAVELTPEAGSQSPNVFRVTHLTESSSTAEDAEHDLPLSLEFAPNVASTTIQVMCGVLLTTGHTGAGADPLAVPESSPGCVAGTYHPSTSISIVAAPAPGSCLASWSGTDDDASVELLNACTPPPGAAVVTAEYVLRDRVVASQDFAGTETVDGGDSMTVGPAVRVLGGGDVLFRADGVIFGDGFSVETGGVLTVETPSRLTCAG